MGTWREIEHTADLAVWVCGDDLRDLFHTAARVMMLLAAKPDIELQPVNLEITLEGQDRDALLVDWLNELLYLSELHGVVFTQMNLLSVGSTSLRARVTGYPIAEQLRGIKAVTYHGLEIVETAEGLCTQIVFDV